MSFLIGWTIDHILISIDNQRILNSVNVRDFFFWGGGGLGCIYLQFTNLNEVG